MTAEMIAKALGGRKAGGSWMARCPAHDDRTPSLSIADGREGRLLVKCWAGCPAQDVFAALRKGGRISSTRPDGARTGRQWLPRVSEGQQNRALELWRAACSIPGTIAEIYLKSRALCGQALPALRFHPRCPHPSGARLPAMVEHVQHGQIAIHRTFLQPDGSGKARIDPNKAGLGPVGGGAVRLAPVHSGKWLVVAEGLETTLSVMCACQLPGWAALSAGGIRSLVLPPSTSMVVICADNDANGVGQRAAYAAAERFLAEGRRVRVAVPPAPGVDFNDVLRGNGAAIIAEAIDVAA